MISDLQYLIFDSLEDYNSLLSTINAGLGYPDDKGTVTYDLPHQSNNGQYAMAVGTEVLQYLSLDQQARLVSYDTVISLGWYPLPIRT